MNFIRACYNIQATEKNKATEEKPATKASSLLCPDCEGNGK